MCNLGECVWQGSKRWPHYYRQHSCLGSIIQGSYAGAVVCIGGDLGCPPLKQECPEAEAEEPIKGKISHFISSDCTSLCQRCINRMQSQFSPAISYFTGEKYLFSCLSRLLSELLEDLSMHQPNTLSGNCSRCIEVYDPKGSCYHRIIATWFIKVNRIKWSL